jgi:hypothetical protein
MELKEFVSSTLTAIVEGIVEAQKKVVDHHAYVNPGGLMRTTKEVSENAVWDNRTNNFARNISFDVALTVEGNTATGAKVGVVAGLFTLGAGGSSENKQQAVSRVQFTIPVLFPTSDLPAGARAPKA